MAHRRTLTPPTNQPPYQPALGELVKDLKSGRLGVYMDTLGADAYLRPPNGGVEWTTAPAAISRLDGAVVVHLLPGVPRGSDAA
jgi:hypothetical protein